MARNTTAPVQNLDRSVGDARLDGRTDQPRWNRVLVLADLDVIVGRDHALVPFGIAVRLGRKRIERWPIDGFQQLGPALADLAHHLGVEIAYALPDGGVEFDEREEPPVAQPRQDEARDDQYSLFDRTPAPCRRRNRQIASPRQDASDASSR